MRIASMGEGQGEGELREEPKGVKGRYVQWVGGSPYTWLSRSLSGGCFSHLRRVGRRECWLQGAPLSGLYPILALGERVKGSCHWAVS